jgi:hypothetical protein
MAEFHQEPSMYDIAYGVVSVAITNTGITVVATTEANYHGFKLITNTAVTTVKVWDSKAASTGNLLDVALLGVTLGTSTYTWIPTKAKVGIVVSVTGTGATGIVFYGPKG